MMSSIETQPVTEMSKSVPQHVAIIMDGNGRWATGRNLPRFRGHLEGVKRVEEVVDVAREQGIRVLTLFAFSTENWSRPAGEISMLMKTLCMVLERKLNDLKQMNIRINLIGRRDRIPVEVLKCLERTAKETESNTGLILNLAFNYGARCEIVDAIRRIAAEVKEGRVEPDDITEETVTAALYTSGLPDPDLLIRTSGEKRISNFLLWQVSYAELYFTPICWPDFNRAEFERALEEYACRDRRYGGIDEAGESET